MSKKEIRQVYNDLVAELTSRDFLDKAGLQRETMMMILNRDYWEAQMKNLFPIRKRYTCQQLFDICRWSMALMGPEPEEGWMAFTYKYVCHILYPEKEFTEQYERYRAGAIYYLTILRFFFDLERTCVPFETMKDFRFLSDEEALRFDTGEEYIRFKKAWHDEFIYEMMRLNAEVTQFNTLEHIAGVHYVSMVMARGLLAAGAPIDLALMSGAAAGHDLGKFGCKPNEKVPFMHYYYTALWFDTHEMRYIGHIAANHSSWDLEPENLSVESLTLIYSDTRVKQSRGKDGKEITKISSLEESFSIILKKMFNVDAAKELRYKFVYSKLSDFEAYMRANGVDVDLNGNPAPPEVLPEVVLRNPEQIVRSLVFMAIEHNVDVMRRMTAERQFGELLESARSEKNWKNVRAYLNILREYFTYTNDTQKEQTLSFLYELFMHRDGEIRTQSAELMGEVIAQFNAGYRKRRPEGMKDIAQEKVLSIWKHYLEMIICPDQRLIDQQQRRISSQLKNVLQSLSEKAEPGDFPMFIAALMDWYREPEKREARESFVLLNSVEIMPFAKMTDEDITFLVKFALAKSEDPTLEVRTAAWRSFKQITAFTQDLPVCAEIADYVEKADASESMTKIFLKYRILSNLGKDTEELKKILYSGDVVSDISLDNLKTDTPWIVKAVNLKLLADQAENGEGNHTLHIAAHFSNMIKVGQFMLVRNTAGQALIRIAPQLTADQRNEIAVEMLRGLETGETNYSRSIPLWLGQFVLWLPAEQLDEMLKSLKGLLASPSDQVVSVALDTIGIMLENYTAYRDRFPEEQQIWAARWEKMVGMLLTGMASYREKVRQEAMLVIGQSVFGSRILSRQGKKSIFALACRKILFQLVENRGGELTHFYRAASLSNLYRFITEYRLLEGAFDLSMRTRVAFFPGTFDPFTLSHKGIARIIRDLGFEVYLSVDEFAWSKKAQPHYVRRQIVNMSVADEFHVDLFPADIPLNPGNPTDLAYLKQLFPGREVYLVVGSDVIAHASFYRNPDVCSEVRAMNHIAFRRVGDEEIDSKYNREMMKAITGHLVELELPEELEEISSTKIRENIDRNRDISNLIDPVVEEYIYNNGLYLREPEYKPIVKARAYAFEDVPKPDQKLYDEIGEVILSTEEEGDRLLACLRKSHDRMLLFRNSAEDNRLIGAARYRFVAPDDLFDVFHDVNRCDIVRRRTSSKILLINAIYVGMDCTVHDAEQLLLTEMIIRSYAQKCDTAVYLPQDQYYPNMVTSAVIRQGFLREDVHSGAPFFIVDTHAPLMLLQNMETALKEPFSSNERVLEAIYKAQEDLQHSMAKLYPGQLVLPVSATLLFHRLVDKITALNQVPREPVVPRKLGELMCVPFGKIIRGKVMPNTVTKTLHTDRIYEPDLQSNAVEAFPGYTPLPTQVRAIRSFRRPVILVDDVLNRSGLRIGTLEPMLKKEGIDVRLVLLGVMTGYGRDTLTTMNLKGDSVYFIPNMRYWFAESTLYPFIGGDTVRREGTKVAGLAPSINLIQPYTQPPLSDADPEALFSFSACCLKNARDVLRILEQEYRAIFARNLTLSRLSEAVNLPLCPDRGECINYDPNLAASVYLQNDLDMLARTRVDTRAATNRYTGR